MQVSQYYETTIVDEEHDLTAQFLVVPARCLPEDFDNSIPESALQSLGLTGFAPVRPGHILHAVASFIATQPEEFMSSWNSALPGHMLSSSLSNAHYQFAEYLTMADVLPFEASPLTGESFGKLFVKPTGVGIGALAGFVVAGNTPLLFVWVPAGMILFGVSAGIARALEEGLRDRLLKLMKKRHQ